MKIVQFPLPDPLNGATLEKELAEAGFTNPHVSVGTDGLLNVSVGELTDPVPTQKEVDECVHEFIDRCESEAASANVSVVSQIEDVIAAHVPADPPPPKTVEEKVASLGLTKDELVAFLKDS